MKNTKFVIVVLTPVFLFMLVFQVVPIFLGLGISLFDYNPLRAENHFIGFSNFVRIAKDPVFYKAFGHTVYFVVLSTGFNIVLTLLIAQIISAFKRNKIRSLFRVIFFMPCVAPLAATGFIWRMMYDKRFGLINMFFSSFFGIAPRAWLGEAGTVMNAIIVFSLWADIGYNILLFCAGIDGIPSDFYEAAVIDGAGPLSRFFKITLPLLARTMCFVLAMTLIFYFQTFAQFEVMQNNHGGPNDIGLVLSLLIYRTAFVSKNMGYASTISLALLALIMIFTIISQRLNKVDWGY
ncbi:MAG: sugar ABC transporter permease [Treponema sp.]|jgi:multiple sugar transport system permease protein/raffinose/stachyose/melibiose transport system permease protein|nr:sugar ABC transporter permease [Treponema sp.]